jgi:hypothetical protein
MGVLGSIYLPVFRMVWHNPINHDGNQKRPHRLAAIRVMAKQEFFRTIHASTSRRPNPIFPQKSLS